MAGRTYFERRCIRTALDTYLQTAGWTNLTFDEGFMSEKTIVNPLITVEIIRPVKKSLQMGNISDKLFQRIVQFDCYMESEPRAMQVTDDIMEFADMVPIQIVDNTTAILGSLICYDTESISADVLPPVLVDPKLIRWRGIVRATYEAHYPN